MKIRSWLGLVGGVLILLSSAAHSILGWSGIHGQLLAAGVGTDLVDGLRIGWQFGGIAMVAFGVIAILTCVARLRGRAAPAIPLVVIGIAYSLFGGWASWASHGDPFLSLVFLLPGVLLVASGLPAGRTRIPSPTLAAPAAD